MAFKMKGNPFNRGLYMGETAPYKKVDPKEEASRQSVMRQGKFAVHLKNLQNDLRNAKDEEEKRKIKRDIDSTMEEMQLDAGMSMKQIKNIGGKDAYSHEDV